MESSVPRLLDQRWVRIAGIGFAILLTALVGAGAYWLAQSGAGQDVDPISIAQTVVSRRLAAGLTPHFSSRELTKVQHDGQRYIVSGSLQAVGQQGEVVGIDYTVELLKGPDGWSSGKVDLLRE